MSEKIEILKNQREKMIFLIKNALVAYESTTNLPVSREEFMADFLLSENDVIALPCNIGSTVYIVDEDCFLEMIVTTIEILGCDEHLFYCENTTKVVRCKGCRYFQKVFVNGYLQWRCTF